MQTSHYIRIDEASLAALDMCDYYGEGYIITRVNVPVAHRARGHGRELMRRVIHQADQEGVTLWLEISAYPGALMQNAELVDWYRRRGFEYEAGVGGLMRRPPGAGDQNLTLPEDGWALHPRRPRVRARPVLALVS